MPRTSSLEPRKIASREKAGKASWCLNVPAELSPTGKRQQLFFDLKKDAQTEVETLEARRDNFGVSLTEMTPARIAEASEAYKRLEGQSISLLDAVGMALALHKDRNSSLPFGELFDLYLARIQKRSAKHRDSMRQTKERFPSLHKSLACDVTPKMLDELLLPLPPASRDLAMRHWRSVFRYGIKREYLRANPIERMDFAGSAPKDVKIYDVAAIESLLGDALQNDLGLLPFYVFGFLCGIRPENELENLEWRYVHLDKRKQVAIPATISKTHKYREADLSSNAIAWLREYKAKGGQMEGKVIQWEHENLRKHRKASAERVNVQWVQDGMRHSFASYWLPIHHDVDRLMGQMGHTDPATFSRHYHAGVPRAQAKKFWAIRPKKLKPGNVIQFKHAQAA
jgi:integrase